MDKHTPPVVVYPCTPGFTALLLQGEITNTSAIECRLGTKQLDQMHSPSYKYRRDKGEANGINGTL